MHNVIDIALSTVQNTIPPEILQLAFNEVTPNGFKLPIHEVIRRKIILSRVLRECNLLGGNVKSILLKQEYVEKTLPNELNVFSGVNNYQIYRIPAQSRDNVGIVEVMQITPSVPGANGYGFMGTHVGRDMNFAAATVLDSFVGSTYQLTPMVELLTGDLICITPGTYSYNGWILTARLEYDQNLTNLNLSAIMPFADLVVAATKSFIYNNLVLKIGKTFITGGSELPELMEIVRSYAEQEERYKELLTAFTGASMLDPARMATLLPFMV